MDFYLVINALGLVAYLSAIIIIAALVGAAIAGVLRVVTQIDDQVISFAGKLACVSLLFYLVGTYFSSELIEFASALWGRSEYYK